MFSSKDLFFTVPSGFRVSNSLRFRSSASAYLNRTAGTPTDNKKWTWSGWVKIGSLSQVSAIISGGSTANDYMMFGYNITTANGFYFLQSTGGVTTINLSSVAIWRDPSAWYHWVIVYDSANATQANRFKFYVNGVEQTYTTTTAIALNQASYINSNAQIQYIGTRGYSALPFDGYLAQVNFIDGQALTPSSFGAYDTNGIWQPTAYSGSGYGTNGFYLPFSNTTSTTTLVADSSGNGNNWTPNNISLTTGTTYDSMIDSPTNYADGGNGRGNYAVLNPLETVTNSTLSNANLTHTLSGTTGSSHASSIIMTSGKWYWEVSESAVTNQAALLGILRANLVPSAVSYTSNPSGVYYNSSGGKYIDGTSSAYNSAWGSTGTTYVIGVALDVDSGTVTFYLNNASQGAITLPSNTFGWKTSSFWGSSTGTGTFNYNFGQQPFTYTPPSGFSALNTQNLPTPTIANGAQYMAAVLYTGTGSSQTITASSSNSGNNPNGTTFQPDWVWVKGRSGATDHAWYDVVRGVQLQIESNTITAETTETTGLTAFTSSGFTTGALAQMNTNTATYVAWEWLAGTAPTTNNVAGAGNVPTAGSVKINGSDSSATLAGSIAATRLSANTSAGFSVVTYTGTGANATVGHGLGVAPHFYITARRSSGGAYFGVYHVSLGNTQALYLQTTDSAQTNSAFWNNTSPTSSVFSLGTSAQGNSSSQTYVAYCFAPVAGYSAFGSYTGNGSTDGTFVYTGFRPRYVMIKCSSVAGTGWYIYDTSRNTYNVLDLYLRPEVADAEGTLATMDVLSNGFKLRSSNSQFNGSGNTMIYAAFAENPFKSSRAR